MGKKCNVATPIESVNGIAINRSKRCNTSNYTNSDERQIEYIVMHYTGNVKDNAKNNANYFTGPNRHASAHYFVDDDSIYQSVDANDIAWHCGTSGVYYHTTCRNNNSIGIEMCCTAGNYKVGDKALENAAQLVSALCKYFNISDVDKYVVRHYDVTHKKCPAQMAGTNNANWVAFKNRVKNIINPDVATVLGAGDKLTLSKVALYGSSSAKNKVSDKTGIYYVWSAPVINNRIRITNNINNVGKPGQVTGWINVEDAKKALANEPSAPKSYRVKVIVNTLNIRSGPSTKYKINGRIIDKGVYTIVETKGNWGRLKSNAGWIYLKGYTKKV
jgi:N-acetylmuramoyl-L-alanine amidase CwlA